MEAEVQVQGFWANCLARANKALFGTVDAIQAVAAATTAKVVEAAKAVCAILATWMRWVRAKLAQAWESTGGFLSAKADQLQAAATAGLAVAGVFFCAMFMTLRTWVEVVFYRLDNGLRNSWCFRNLAAWGVGSWILGLVTGLAAPTLVASWIGTAIFYEVGFIIWWRALSAEHRSYVLEREFRAELQAAA